MRLVEEVRDRQSRATSPAGVREIAAALQARLVSAGYVPADHADAELTIFVNYLSDGAWKLVPVSEPEVTMFSAYNKDSGVSSGSSNTPPTAMATYSGLPSWPTPDITSSNRPVLREKFQGHGGGSVRLRRLGRVANPVNPFPRITRRSRISLPSSASIRVIRGKDCIARSGQGGCVV
ncbi:MAG: hypothetical protein IPN11_17050 [Opitutaceae bacterium]|nr:hypothetical protein [Opitutaceae bacterium]